MSQRRGPKVSIEPLRQFPDVDGRWLLRNLRAAIAALSIDRGSIAVRLVGDDEMAELHGRYLGKPQTTDVLTFDLADGGWRMADRGEPSSEHPPSPILHPPSAASEIRTPNPEPRLIEADIVVCIDVARREAARRGHSTERELLLYILHGLLHLLGYDDHDEDSARRMHQREDEVLEHIGVGQTFADDQRPG